MKRILSSIVVLLIFFSCSINCYAAEYKETRTGDVYGKYNFYSNEGIYTAISSDGSYEVTTDNEVHIKVSYSRTELTLVVHQIPKSEIECYDWLKSCIHQSYTDFQAYEIYCINASGERVDLPANTKITMSNTYSNTSVQKVSYSGELNIVRHLVENNNLIFKTIDKDGYYLLCESAKDPQSPQTGDNSNLRLWWILLIVSATSVVVLCVEQRKRNAVK